MLKKNFAKRQSAIISENQKSRLIILGLIALLVVLGLNNYKLRANQKTIITPCGNPENAMWVGNSSISPQYMQAIGRDVLSLALNVTPETVDEQDREFLQYVSPSLRSYIEDHMKANAERIVTNGISQSFYPDNFKVVLATQVLYVTGYLKTYVGNEQTSNVQQIYKIKFNTSDMNVKISEFRQLDPELDKKEISEVGI